MKNKKKVSVDKVSGGLSFGGGAKFGKDFKASDESVKSDNIIENSKVKNVDTDVTATGTFSLTGAFD